MPSAIRVRVGVCDIPPPTHFCLGQSSISWRCGALWTSHLDHRAVITNMHTQGQFKAPSMPACMSLDRWGKKEVLREAEDIKKQNRPSSVRTQNLATIATRSGWSSSTFCRAGDTAQWLMLKIPTAFRITAFFCFICTAFQLAELFLGLCYIRHEVLGNMKLAPTTAGKVVLNS